MKDIEYIHTVRIVNYDLTIYFKRVLVCNIIQLYQSNV